MGADKSPAEAADFFEFASLFLNKNTHLFTIFGIFGAVSVYLGTLTTDLSLSYVDVALTTGIVSGLSLFVLVGVLINIEFKKDYEDFEGSSPTEIPRENILPYVLLVLFDSLLAAISVLVIATLWESWSILLSLVMGGIVFHWSLSLPMHFHYKIISSSRISFNISPSMTTNFLLFVYLSIGYFIIILINPHLPSEVYWVVNIPVIMGGIGLSIVRFVTIPTKKEV